MECDKVSLINNNTGNVEDYKATHGVSESKKMNTAKEPKREKKGTLKEPRIKARHLVVVMAFMSQTMFFYHQITMSVSIVAMVNNSALHQEEDVPVADSCVVIEANTSTQTVEQVEGEFLWSSKIQGYVLGSSFFCTLFAVPISSRIAQTYGAKRVLFQSLFLSSASTFCVPFAAYWNVYALMAVQGLRGLAQGGALAVLSVLVANWCPKQERGFSYTFVLTGCNVGAVVGSYLSGILCERIELGGWKASFFVSGALGFSVSGLVWFFLYDNPSVHPKIALAELHYIINNQENVLTEKRPKAPWKKLLTSVPVYALSCALFGDTWMISHFLSIHPTFLKTILHYSVEESGLFAALPFILAILFSQVSGLLSALLTNRNWVSIDRARKFWTLISSLAYSGCLVAIYFAECDAPVIVILSILAFGMSAVNEAGCWIVCNDMSPTFSASINAVSCTIGNLAYVILPLTAGYLTDNSQTMEQWHKIFIISIVVTLSTSLTFFFFGSAEIQPWNDDVDDREMKPFFRVLLWYLTALWIPIFPEST